MRIRMTRIMTWINMADVMEPVEYKTVFIKEKNMGSNASQMSGKT
jgi:hypothetical protein